MKLILDFDDVLFDTQKLKQRFFTVLSQHGVQNPEKEYHFERKDDRPFSLWLFLKRVCQIEGIPDAGLLYEEVMGVCDECRNEALVEVISELGSENCYIVTNGEDEFQKDKLVRSGVYTLVQGVFIVPGSKKENVESLCQRFKDEEVVFADDKGKFLDDIDEEAAPNLRKVLYDVNGFEKLTAQIQNSKAIELKRSAPQGDGGFLGPKMR